MSSDLDRQIAEAQAADRTLAELEAKRAELPALLAEKQRRQQQQRAAEQLQRATANAQRGRAVYVERVTAFRTEFDLWLKDAQLLAEKLKELEAPIRQLAADLAGTVTQAGHNEIPTDHPAAVWVALGWADVPEALPNRSTGNAGYNPALDERLGAVLAWASGVTPYIPQKGIRGAGITV